MNNLEGPRQLIAKPIDIDQLSTDQANDLLIMLNRARDRDLTASSTNPYRELATYTQAMLMGRDGGYTGFSLADDPSKLVAMSHLTTTDSFIEFDVLARLPGASTRRQLGAQAFRHSINTQLALSPRPVGLYTPERNIELYRSHGFELDEQINLENDAEAIDRYRMKRRSGPPFAESAGTDYLISV